MKQLILLGAMILALSGCRFNEDVIVTDEGVTPPPETPTPTRPPLSTPEPLPHHTPLPPAHLTGLEIDELYEQIFASWITADPEWATDLGVAHQFGVNESQLTDLSDAALQAAYQRDQAHLALLQEIDRASLTPDQVRSLDILLWELNERVQGQSFRYHDYILHQLFSVPNTLPDFLAYVHPLNTREDAENLIARLHQVDTQFAQLIAGSQIRAELGIVPPQFVLDRVWDTLYFFASQPAVNSVIYRGFQERVRHIEGLSEAEREALAMAVLTEIETVVAPAYERLADHVQELTAQATTDDGVWKLPDGDAYYAYALRQHTTTTLTAVEIHELGLQEVARIQGEIQSLMDELGYTNRNQLYQGAGGITIHSDANRQEAILAYREAMRVADQKLTEVFQFRPETPLEIVRVPPYNEGSGPGAYYTSPPLDGSRPGIFFVNLPDGRFISYADIPTLAYHEGTPGHHFQRAIQRQLTHVPTFRKASHVTAFAEGWALYAERLVWEYGVYDENPYGNWGRLQAELFRAVRLVVDTGIHHYRWTREEAIAYMSETLGWPESSTRSEVERYIVWPGQATAYKIGQLTILRLRDEARAALGDQFDIAEFHTAVLQNGDIPLVILEQVIQDYIEETQTAVHQ